MICYAVRIQTFDRGDWYTRVCLEDIDHYVDEIKRKGLRFYEGNAVIMLAPSKIGKVYYSALC